MIDVWPRISELLIGAWLMLTPVLFAGTEAVASFAVRDFVAGLAVAVMALLSLRRPTAGAHFATAVVALVLGLAAYFGYPRPGPPAAQNEIAVAYVLLLFAIIPNQASRPPEPWRRPSS